LLLEDYLLHQLTGQFVTEYALQTSSLMLDIESKEWWKPLLDFIGLSPDRLARLVEPGTIVGPLSEEGSAAVGLSPETIAVSGAMDQVAGAVGGGNVAPGIVTEMTGGALAEVVTLERPTFDAKRRVPCHYHACRNSYCLLPWGQTAGMTLRWFRDQFFDTEAERHREGGVDAYDQMTHLAEQAPAGSDGLVALPHLEGAACPEFNPAARGVFFGIDLRHTRGHFVRAIMESVAYMLKTHLDIVQELGVNADEVRSMGGGARSDLWLQIKADVLQRPVRRVAVEETACLGAAILAAVGVGVHPNLAKATSHMVRLGRVFLPDPELRSVYDRAYRRYLELYERLEPMFGAEEA
jgi:xylulokinase